MDAEVIINDSQTSPERLHCQQIDPELVPEAEAPPINSEGYFSLRNCDTASLSSFSIDTPSLPRKLHAQEDTDSLVSTGTLVPEAIYLPPAGHRLVTHSDWDALNAQALKKAHSGISLSELEASVASPFTSSISNISCITNLIRQGRAALVTTFCVFKFMSLFSLIMFCRVILLYTVVSNFGDWQYLLTDTVMLSLIIFTMSLNPAWKKLVRRTPPTSLMSIPALSSIIFQILNCLLFQIFTFFLVQQQSWYQTPQEIECNDSRFSDCCSLNKTETGALYIIRNFENTSLFYVSAFQYLIVAVVFAKGKPFRQPSYKNWSFVLTCTILYTFILFIMLNPIPAVDELMEIATVPYEWRITLLIIILAHAVLSFILENLILDTLWKFFPTNPGVKWTSKHHTANITQMANKLWGSTFFSRIFCHKKRPPKTKYKYLALKLQEELDWPPAPSTITYAGTPQHISVPF
ncbi:polyamine-transporting ATPase 13A3-like isoform X2 [Festucalex cinctus]